MSEPKKLVPTFTDEELRGFKEGYDDGVTDGRQAQYELHRALNCKRYYAMGVMIVCGKLSGLSPQPCPTDYRECPLTKEPKE